MGRKKKDDAQTKSDQAPAGPGHNAELTDEQRCSLLFAHVADIDKKAHTVAEAKKAFDDAKGQLASLYKIAKGQGFPRDEIEEFRELRSPEGEKNLSIRLERSVRLARWLSLPVGNQGAFDLSPVDRTPSDDRAFNLGKIAGMEAKDCSPPYSAGSSQGQRWIAGWHEGQALNTEALLRMKAPKEGSAEWDENDPDSDGGEVNGMPGADSEMADA
jgi:hypothetical protein